MGLLLKIEPKVTSGELSEKFEDLNFDLDYLEFEIDNVEFEMD